jgi:putative FmdB family regulatory protein
MKPLWDVKCERCDNVFEERKDFADTAGDCPRCGSSFTHTLLSAGLRFNRAKDPYDLLDGRIPDAKKIKSFANDRRKGGKDVT